MNLQIEVPDDNQLSQLNRVIASSFKKSPASKFLFGIPGNVSGFETVLRWAVRSNKVTKYKVTYNEELVGGLYFANEPDCEPRGFNYFRHLLEYTFRVQKTFSSAMRYFLAKNHSHLHNQHCHLIVIGIVEKWRGMGIGTKLMQQYCKHLDENRLIGFLETDTEAAMKLYSRFGFHIVANQIWNGKVFYSMSRPAAKRKEIVDDEYFEKG